MDNVITYGKGEYWTQQGLLDGRKCIAITRSKVPHPVGAIPKTWKTQTEVGECACVLVFENIESARTLQDEINEMIALWSREIAPKVEHHD